MPILIIAEKPSLAKKLASVLGGPSTWRGKTEFGNFVVTHAIGHLLEQMPPEAYDEKYTNWDLAHLPIIPSRWKLAPKGSTIDQFQLVGNLVCKADEIWNCGDADREGQLLIDELLEVFLAGRKQPVIKRAWLLDLTPPGIKKSLGDLRPNSQYRPLSESALARSHADWLIGMNMTRAYTLIWQKGGNSGPLHIGRVQTPTLGLVVARDREIESFVPQDYFLIQVKCRHANGDFWADFFPGNPVVERNGINEKGRIIDRALAKEITDKVRGKTGKVIHVQSERKRVPPPLPYSQSDLQVEVGKQLGLSPKEILDISQTLYERHELTTYPRTDCPYLPENEFQNAKSVLTAVARNLGGMPGAPALPNVAQKSAAWDDKKIAAHFGIIPTTGTPNMDALTPNERRVYEFICRRYIAQFHPHYEYDSTIALIEFDGEKFRAEGQAIVAPGWKVLYPTAASQSAPAKNSKSDSGPPKTQTLPLMAKNDDATAVDAQCNAKKTDPPPRFDGPSLLDAMRNAHRYVTDPVIKATLKEIEGIGTDATRGEIIDNLITRGYIEETKKSRGKGTDYMSSEKGRALIDVVDDRLSKVDLTAWFENQFSEIAAGKVDIEAFTGTLNRYVGKQVENAKALPIPQKLALRFPTAKGTSPGAKSSQSGRPRKRSSSR